tara:strand:+ start:696 stop:1133 length:438 start_codon:yes stop_codon:yes gene_type:complete
MGENIDETMYDLIEAIENENNSSIIDLTSSKIKKFKNDILQQLQLPGFKVKEFHKKLKDYRYCTDLKDLQEGFFIRWIPLSDPTNIKLTNGGIVCDIKLVNGALHVLCKNANNWFFQIKFDEVIIFQKLSNQERIILSILDYLEK